MFDDLPELTLARDLHDADGATHANHEELFLTYSPDTIPQGI